MLEFRSYACSYLEIIKDEQSGDDCQANPENGADRTENSLGASGIRKCRRSDGDEQAEQRDEQKVAQAADCPKSPALVPGTEWEQLHCAIDQRRDDQQRGEQICAARHGFIYVHT